MSFKASAGEGKPFDGYCTYGNRQYSFTDSIPVGIYEGFEIDFSTVNP